MKKEAYEESTIKFVGKRLKYLQKYCNFADPENIKTHVANKSCSNAYKESLIEAYAIYMRSIGQTWNQPFYNRYDKSIKVPSTTKIETLIGNSSKTMSLILSMSRDLGTRPIELTWLKVNDIDLEKGIVTITGAKHTMGGTGKLKSNTLEMLKIYIAKKHLKINDRLFPIPSATISEMYRRQRNRLAEKLQDPTLKQIRLYDFRHYKASVVYQQTNSLMHVKTMLRHKDIRTTIRYTHIFDNTDSQDYHCAVAKNIQEATNLIENGFEYVTEMDGIKLFRKRK